MREHRRAPVAERRARRAAADAQQALDHPPGAVPRVLAAAVAERADLGRGMGHALGRRRLDGARRWSL